MTPSATLGFGTYEGFSSPAGYELSVMINGDGSFSGTEYTVGTTPEKVWTITGTANGLLLQGTITASSGTSSGTMTLTMQFTVDTQDSTATTTYYNVHQVATGGGETSTTDFVSVTGGPSA